MQKLTTQKQIRALFWQTFPNLSRKKIRDYSGNGLIYTTDTRCAFCDFLDSLHRDGLISDGLADRAAL